MILKSDFDCDYCIHNNELDYCHDIKNDPCFHKDKFEGISVVPTKKIESIINGSGNNYTKIVKIKDLLCQDKRK